MRKLLSIIVGLAVLCLSLTIKAQTTLYFENFNGGGAAFTLNASDIGSDPAASGNRWVTNATYTSLFGVTPDQPTGIIGNPNSTYMHIRSALTANATFLAPADGNKLAKMNAGVSTIGATSVTLSFWLLCNGDAIATDAYFGRTYYSIDGGTTWIQNPTTYVQIDSWTQVTVTNPIFDNQADLRFAFMWVQNSANEFVAADPTFSVDDIKIEGITSVTNTITTGTITGSPFCAGATFNVPFTSTGTFAAGNIYTAQLSDAAGSFASPTNIGTLNSTANTGSISVTIPGGAATGSGYLIRVISSNPAITGASSLALTINAPITPTFNTVANVCQNSIAPVLPTSSTNATPITGTWSPAVSTAIVGTTVYTFTPTAGQCASTTSLSITVDAPTTPTFAAIGPFCQNTAATVLPLSSTNTPAISGTWSPATINTATIGTSTYTFTPDPGQCAVVTTVDIEITAPNITPSFAQLGPLCLNASAPSLPSSSTNATPVTGSWSPSSINTSVVGITTYTFTPVAGQCATTATMDIEITNSITPTFAAIGPFCQNTAATVLPLSSTNTPAISGTWAPGTINTAIIGTTTYTFTPNPGQCAVVTTVNIEITAPNITPSFAQLGPLCLNASAPALPSSSTNAIPVTGSWSPSIINTSVVGITTYTFTPDAGQCATTATMDIEITNAITPTFAAIGPFCQNTTATVLPLSSTNTPAILGTWSPGTINTATIGTTTYTFTPNPGQCAAATTVDIDITAPNITPSFAQLGPLCLNASAPALPSSSINAIPVTGSWSPSSINTSVVGITTYTFTPDAGQCATTATMDIEITSSIVPSFSSIGPLCFGSVAPSLPSSSTNIPAITGTWNPSTINTSIIGPANYSFTADPNQCATNTSITIDITNSITPTFVAIAPLCSGAVAPALPSVSTNVPSISGTWNPPLINTSLVGVSTYTFTPDPGQCGATTTLDVEVISAPPSPTLSITASLTTICAGQTVDFTAIPNSFNTGDVIQWFVNGSAVTGGTGLLFSSNSLNNNDQITAVFTPSSSCLAGQFATSNLILITVNPTVTPTISISSSTSQICEGSNIDFSAIIGGGGSNPQIQWFINGNAVAGANSSTFSSSTLSNSETVTAQLTSNLTCAIPNTAISNSISITVLPIATPTISITSDKTLICVGQQVVFNASFDFGGSSPEFEWQVGGSSFTTSTPTFTTTNLNSSVDVTCTLNSSYACATNSSVLSNTINIQVNPVPSVTLSEDVTIQEGESTTLTATTAAALTYLWTPATNLSCTDCLTPTANPTETTVYTFLVTDTLTNCSSNDSVKVTVIRNYDIWVPTAFSPNNDSHNDFFFVRGNNVKEFTIRIFDRWGNKVYESSNLAEGWNGEYQNRIINSGVLVYVLDFTLNDGTIDTRKGNITVSN